MNGKIIYRQLSHSFLLILFFIIAISSNYAQKSEEQKETEIETMIPNSVTSTGDKVEIKNSTGNSILTITDEGGDGASITFHKAVPSVTTEKLYNGGDVLYFNGSEVGSKLSSFQLTTNPSDGFILTSDANGNASWQKASNSQDNDWAISGSDIYSSNTGNVGIGSSSPSDKLEVVSSTGADALRVRIGSATKLRVFANGGTAIGSNNSAGTPANGLYVNGNVGLGVSNPTDKLEVNGKLKTTNLQMTNGATDGYVLTSDTDGNGSWQALSNDDNDWRISGNNMYSLPTGRVGIGTSNPSQKLHVNGTILADYIHLPNSAADGYVLTSDAIGFASWRPNSWTVYNNDIYLARSGNVGIGTETPTEKLEVDGKIKSTYLQMTNGAADGYVLTSDANGNASWQEGSSSGIDDDWTINGNLIYRYNNTGIWTQTPNSLLSIGGSGTNTASLSVETTSTSNYAIYGKTDNSGFSVGVYGTVSGAGGNTESIGVYGYNTSGVGVQGTAGNGGIGVLGTLGGATFGTAGRFEGPVEVTGKLSVGANPTIMAYQLAVDGSAAKSSGGTSWAVASDRRLKNIRGEYNKGLSEIERLNTIIFNYKDGNPLNLPTDNTEYGFIAQDVQKIFPEAVSEMDNGYLDFNFHPIHVAMVNAVKELSQENKVIKEQIKSFVDQNDKIEVLENENARLKKEMDEIKFQVAKFSELFEAEKVSQK